MEGLECFVEATRSLNDEFGSAISGDISLISGSYMIILAYTIFNLSSTPLLKSRIVLSLGAIVVRPLGGAFFFCVDAADHLALTVYGVEGVGADKRGCPALLLVRYPTGVLVRCAASCSVLSVS